MVVIRCPRCQELIVFENADKTGMRCCLNCQWELPVGAGAMSELEIARVLRHATPAGRSTMTSSPVRAERFE
jgi:hypothetical protein